MIIFIFFLAASMSIDFPSPDLPPPTQTSAEPNPAYLEDIRPREKNKELVMTMIEAFNDRDFDKLQTFFADNYVYHSDTTTVKGAAEMVARMKNMADAFNLQMRFYHLVGEGEQVAYHVEAIGKHTGTYNGIASTNKDISVHSIGIIVIRDGKIVEEWEILDEAKLMQQLK